MIHALTKANGMRVVAFHSAPLLRAAGPNAAEGDEAKSRAAKSEGELWSRLQVVNGLTGSVRISGSRLRVRAQLIERNTGVCPASTIFSGQRQLFFPINDNYS
ncbi:MAG TPA: hypothetical protein VKV17_07090 [Bryobacteraceae bacterium]|nr:hypothetical protein [Bryobacteraceae bacterium]